MPLYVAVCILYTMAYYSNSMRSALARYGSRTHKGRRNYIMYTIYLDQSVQSSVGAGITKPLRLTKAGLSD